MWRLDLLWGIKVTCDTAARIEGHLAALIAGPVDPLRGKNGGVVSAAGNITPHDFRVVGICKHILLRKLNVLDEIADVDKTSVGFHSSRVWIGRWP